MLITYIDRKTSKLATEEVYGGKALAFLYGGSKIGAFLATLLGKLPFFSVAYGFWQTLFFTKKKIAPFIQHFRVDSSEFLLPVEKFKSFNDFFIRRLKKEARPITPGTHTAIIPADGRYRFFPNIEKADGFVIKGKKFSLAAFLQDDVLASQYAKGSMVLARLCPVDYHRFHFPCDGRSQAPHAIKGGLYSVNPIALKKNIEIYTENKRVITLLETPAFGTVLYVEIGATNVGTIHQTFTPCTPFQKGDEKGYFSFGGSALALLFLPGSIEFEEDLLEYSQSGLEILCQMGQPMGSAPT